MISAVLFDMNGVIIADEHIHEMAFRETLKPFGIELQHQDYLKLCAGKTDGAGYDSVASFFNLKLPTETLVRQKSQRYLELFPSNKQTYLGVLDLIHTLSKKLVLALTSSSSRSEVDQVIKQFDLESYFKATISADDVHLGKPHPEPYLLTCKKINMSPKQCVVIEDSRNGVMAARAAGCYCIGITTTHARNELMQSHVVVDEFAEITHDFINELERN